MSAPPRRSYGYTETGQVVPEEARIIREAAAALLNSRPAVQVCDELNAAGHRTAGGHEWHPTTLFRVLLSPKVAGQRLAPPILETATADALQELKAGRRTAGLGRPRGSGTAQLLSGGLLRCAPCGSNMHATRRTSSTAQPYGYRCPPDGGACGTQTIVGPALDAYVTAQAIAALAAMRRPGGTDPQALEMAEALADLDLTASTLSRSRDAGIMTEPEYTAAARRLRARREQLQARRAEALGHPLPPTRNREALAGWFAEASTDLARGVLRHLWRCIEISPTTRRGYPGIDPARVHFIAHEGRTRIAG